MPSPADMLSMGDIVAIDRAYMDYGKHEKITRIGAFYVTEMEKGLHVICPPKVGRGEYPSINGMSEEACFIRCYAACGISS